MLQLFPSSQRASCGVDMQVPLPSQTSAVQTNPSLFSQLVPAGQLGWWQTVSAPLQTSLVQGFESSGHGAPFPLIMSAGHAALDPVQLSATSQGPAEARQTVDDVAKPSAGQIVLVPVQVSATSHGPAAARQVAPALPAGCWQASCVPSH